MKPLLSFTSSHLVAYFINANAYAWGSLHMAGSLRSHTFDLLPSCRCTKGRITLSSHPPGIPPFYNDAPQCGGRSPSYIVTKRPPSASGMLEVPDIPFLYFSYQHGTRKSGRWKTTPVHLCFQRGAVKCAVIYELPSYLWASCPYLSARSNCRY